MKRKTTATPANDILTTQRLVLTAPDGSPRAELALNEHTLPTLRMFDPAGVCRIELGLECSDEPKNGSWPTVQFNDTRGALAFTFYTDDQRADLILNIAGVKVLDLEIDALTLAGALARDPHLRRRSTGVSP